MSFTKKIADDFFLRKKIIGSLFIEKVGDEKKVSKVYRQVSKLMDATTIGVTQN